MRLRRAGLRLRPLFLGKRRRPHRAALARRPAAPAMPAAGHQRADQASSLASACPGRQRHRASPAALPPIATSRRSGGGENPDLELDQHQDVPQRFGRLQRPALRWTWPPAAPCRLAGGACRDTGSRRPLRWPAAPLTRRVCTPTGGDPPQRAGSPPLRVRCAAAAGSPLCLRAGFLRSSAAPAPCQSSPAAPLPPSRARPSLPPAAASLTAPRTAAAGPASRS